MTVTLRKDNSPGTIKRYAPHQIQTPAKYLRPSDLLILARLSRRTSYIGAAGRRRSARHAAPDPANRPRPLGNGRGSSLGGRRRNGRARSPGSPEPDASQQATLALDEGLIGVRIPAPWYVDPQPGRWGRSVSIYPSRVVTRLLNAPPSRRKPRPRCARNCRAACPRRSAGAGRTAAAGAGPGADAPASAADQRHPAERSQLRPRLGAVARPRPV